MTPPAPTTAEFQGSVLDYYRDHGRKLAWREDTDGYTIYVSEFMLQQTQVSRVQKAFEPFRSRFPDFATLADAPFSEVLSQWRGLGYNRRARYLYDGARTIVDDFGGTLPSDPRVLQSFRGIGPNTAASMACFAYNVPVVFVETNIRRVILHTFFRDMQEVADREVLAVVAATLYRRDPRRWYWALMDYGSELRRQVENPNRRSAHYTKQSRFDGSLRQLRGRVLAIVAEEGWVAEAEVPYRTGFSEEQSRSALEGLERDNLVRRADGTVYPA